MASQTLKNCMPLNTPSPSATTAPDQRYVLAVLAGVLVVPGIPLVVFSSRALSPPRPRLRQRLLPLPILVEPKYPLKTFPLTLFSQQCPPTRTCTYNTIPHDVPSRVWQIA